MGRFCLFSFIFQLPFYTLVFSEWGCFFLLVRLGRGGYKGLSFPVKESPCYTNLRYLFILLSSEKNEPRSAAAVIGLLACRYGRRRGLRNSLRSNSPRPFPSVFLATSPPDKGGIGDCCFCLYSNPLCFINPSVLRTPPLYFAVQNTPQCCGTRQGECVRFDFVTVAVFSTPLFFQPLRPCGHLPYILLCKTPRNATGHGRGGEVFSFRFCSDFIRDTL